MVSWRSIKECEVVRDGGSEQCDTAKCFGSMRWCEGAKVRRCEDGAERNDGTRRT